MSVTLMDQLKLNIDTGSVPPSIIGAIFYDLERSLNQISTACDYIPCWISQKRYKANSNNNNVAVQNVQAN